MFFDNPELEAMQALKNANNVKASNSVFVELEHVVIKKDKVTVSYSSYTDDWESEILVIYNGIINNADILKIDSRSIYIDGKLHTTGESNIGINMNSFDQKVNERIQSDIEKKLKLMHNTDMETKAMGFDLLDSLCMINEEYKG